MEQRKEFITINTESEYVQPKTKMLEVYDGKNPLLVQPIPEYTLDIPNEVLTDFIEKLRVTKKMYGGIGIAANQCGYPLRAFIIGGAMKDINIIEYVCINPKIVEKSPEVDKGKEGCLSFPGLFLNINRPTWIKVEYTNEFGELKQETLSGITARCFCHELDHLDGIRFTDRVGSLALKMAKDKRAKLIKKIKRHQIGH